MLNYLFSVSILDVFDPILGLLLGRDGIKYIITALPPVSRLMSDLYHVDVRLMSSIQSESLTCA